LTSITKNMVAHTTALQILNLGSISISENTSSLSISVAGG
jgi:hypothetical protein